MHTCVQIFSRSTVMNKKNNWPVKTWFCLKFYEFNGREKRLHLMYSLLEHFYRLSFITRNLKLWTLFWTLFFNLNKNLISLKSLKLQFPLHKSLTINDHSIKMNIINSRYTKISATCTLSRTYETFFVVAVHSHKLNLLN